LSHFPASCRQNCDNLEAVAYDSRLKEFPYHPLWRIAANYFLPRWCRNEDAERKFAEYAANSTKKKLGEGLYGFIAWDVFVKERGNRQKFGAYKFEWPRIRQGLLDLIDRYPSALLFYHRLAFFAQYYDDRATARMLFEKAQLVWSSAAAEIWGNRGYYEQARQWAAVKPAEPFIARGTPQSSSSNAKALDESTSWVASAASKWPPLFLINRVRLSDGLEYFFNSFLVSSAKGVVAVTALTKFGKEQSYMSNISRKPAVFVTAMPLTTFRAKMQEWTIYAPQKPQLKISPALIEPKTNPENYEGVVVTFDPSTKLPAVRVLKRYESPPATEFPHFRVYVVACRPGQAPCQQAAFAGETKSGGVGSNGQRVFVFQLDDPVPWGELIGSPVINEDGNVIAVVTSPSEPVARANDETTFIAGEDVNSVLVRAGY